MFDNEKIEIYRKLPVKEAKVALLEYLKENFDVAVAANYSFDKILKTAEQKITERHELELARNAVTLENFTRTNVTPHDLINNPQLAQQYHIDRTELEDAPEPVKWEANTVPVRDTLKPAPVVPSRILSAQQSIPSVQVQMQGACDMILPETFRPNLIPSMKTPDGKDCINLPFHILDEVVKIGVMWKAAASSSRYHRELMSLIHYIQKDGEVVVRETRNSAFVVLR